MNNPEKLKKANELLSKANKKMKQRFNWFSNKYEDALLMLTEAINSFKMVKDWSQVGRIYQLIGDCHSQLGDKYKAATAYVQAFDFQNKEENEEENSTYCIENAIKLYHDIGNFNRIARCHEKCAIFYEKNRNFKKAVENYKKAAEYFFCENMPNQSSKCSLNAANLCANIEEYIEAINIYEEQATICLNNNVLKWNTKEYFLKAGICYLCLDDLVGAQRAIEKYIELDFTFKKQRECRFLKQLMHVYKTDDSDLFTRYVREYDSISTLDAWKTHLLLKIKKNIKNSCIDNQQSDDIC